MTADPRPVADPETLAVVGEVAGSADAAGAELTLATQRQARPSHVLVVHRNLLVAQVLARRLEGEDDLTWVGATDDDEGAVKDAASVDLVVLDPRGRRGLGPGAGLLARILSLPDAPLVIVLSDPGDDPLPSLLAGARGWVPVDVGPDVLVEAVRAVLGGSVWIPPARCGGVLDRLLNRGRTTGRLSVLTDRQLAVLQCMVDGLRNDETAKVLYMSANTARTHRRRLFSKLDVHSALEAVAVAREAGLSPR